MSRENPHLHSSSELGSSPVEPPSFSREKVEQGLAYAHSLVKRNELPSVEFNTLVSAHRALESGQASSAQIEQLKDLVLQLEQAKAFEKSNADLRKQVDERIGSDKRQQIEGTTHSLDVLMKVHAIEAHEEDPANVDGVINLWRELSNNLSKRLQSENLRDPEKVEAALRLANALLEAHPTREGERAAKEGIEQLRRRFDL